MHFLLGAEASIADILKQTSDSVTSNSGYVYDEQTGLYFDKISGYYYDPVSLISSLMISSRKISSFSSLEVECTTRITVKLRNTPTILAYLQN